MGITVYYLWNDDHNRYEMLVAERAEENAPDYCRECNDCIWFVPSTDNVWLRVD